MSTNADFFQRLLDSSFEVDCGELGKLKCRELPMTTLVYLITELGTTIGDKVEDASVAISLAFAKMQDVSEAPSAVAISNVFTSLLPMFSGAIQESPELLKRFLKDVVIDITDDDVELLSIPVAVKIVDAQFDKLDEEDVVQRLAEVFTKATTIATKAQEVRSKRADADTKKTSKPAQK